MPVVYPAGKVLKHCDKCNRWGAIYLVEDPNHGRLRLCHRCWQERVAEMAKAKDQDPPTNSNPKTTEERSE